MSASLLTIRVMKAPLLVAFVMATCLLAACHNDTDNPKVSEESISLNTRRFDRDLAAVDTAHIAQSLPQLRQKYPDFLDFWLDNLMQFGVYGHYSDTAIGVHEHLHTFLTYKDFRGLFDTVAKHYPNTKSIDEPLRKGFAYYRHYYP